MITHRLSSLKLADRVILLKNNSIHDINMTNISDIDALETIIDSFSSVSYTHLTLPTKA